MSTRIVILGAGPAGVGAAWRLRVAHKAEVTVLERQADVGGNAGSFELAGIPVDYGSHRLHPACDPAIMADVRGLLGDDLLDRPRHGRIRLRGRWIHFPLKPVDLLLHLPPSFGLGVAADALRKLAPARAAESHETFASILRRGLGRTICRDFYFPFAVKIWGLDPEALSPIQARRRVSAGSLGKMVRKVLAAVPGLKPPGAGRFFYPRGGFGQISRSIADAARQAGADLRLNTSVTGLQIGPPHRVEFTADDAMPALRLGMAPGMAPSAGGSGAMPKRSAGMDAGRGMSGESRWIEADHVWSTLPITLLARLTRPAPPADVLEAAGGISYRAMILIYLVLDQPRFTEFDAHYFPDANVPLTRLSEPKNYSARIEPAGRTVLCGELPCQVGDAHWTAGDSELGELVVESLRMSNLPIRGQVLSVTTRRLPSAYPIYRTGYEVHFDKLDAWASELPNVLTFGRQGLFAHDNTHHALAMAYAAVHCLDAAGRFDRDRWARYRQEFASHVVED